MGCDAVQDRGRPTYHEQVEGTASDALKFATLASIDSKLRRLDTNCPLRVLDLFAGCGGFSLGFKSAGFTIAGSVESDPAAANTHAWNLAGGAPGRPLDITELNPHLLPLHLERVSPIAAVDVIIGGPPCQSFTRVGRAKLNSERGRASEWRSRANLYSHYLDYVRELRPIVILLENVPDMLKYQQVNVAEIICEELNKLGYVTGSTLLNSAFYGVPQFRERLYVMAYHKSLGCRVHWPSYTHRYDLPTGYTDIRAFARTHDFLDRSRLGWSIPRHLPAAVTAREALDDLPVIVAPEALARGELTRLHQRFGKVRRYSRLVNGSEYGHLMRCWPGFENTGGVMDHVIRRLPRDFPIFAEMQPGDQYPEAHRIAVELFESEARRQDLTCESNRWRELRRRMVPPYPVDRFPNKWRKLDPDEPSRTLMAHLSHDSYSHIHYDSSQARTISVREAARLQSFPDGFLFKGSMNAAFRQIGNAVPPLVAYALARSIGQQLNLTLQPEIREIG